MRDAKPRYVVREKPRRKGEPAHFEVYDRANASIPALMPGHEGAIYSGLDRARVQAEADWLNEHPGPVRGER